MKILILSCSTGGGHNAAAKATAAYLAAHGHDVTLTDAFALRSERTARTVGKTYVNVAKSTPRLFGGAYSIAMRISSDKRRSPVYFANGRLRGLLDAYIRKNGFEAVVMSHLFPAETITDMRRRGMLDIPSVVICTDYTCIPFWEETHCDAYILPHEDLLPEYAARGMETSALYPFGIPVDARFAVKKDKAAARRELGLRDLPGHLVIGGSMGFGGVRQLVTELARDENAQTVAVCGSNESMRRMLESEFSGNPRVHIVGFTDRVSDYMDACDVVYTKPGGLTSTEALVKNIPIVHTEPIPGCETRNRAFFASHGLSLPADGAKHQAQAGQKLLHDERLRADMIAHQKRCAHPDSAARIEELLVRLAQKKAERA